MLHPVLVLALLGTAGPESTTQACYSIEARFDEAAGLVSGTETMRLLNQSSDTVSELRLYFGSSRVSAVSVNGRAARASDKLLALEPPVLPGESAVIELAFSVDVEQAESKTAGRLTAEQRRRRLFHDWYPVVAATCSSHHSVTGSLHVMLTLPGDLAVATNAELTDSGTELAWLRLPPSIRPTLQREKTLSFEAPRASGFSWFASPDLVLLEDSVKGSGIHVFVPERNWSAWGQVPGQVARIVAAYLDWYGPLPDSQLTVVVVPDAMQRSASLPGLVLVSESPIPGTRFLEGRLARHVAYQWFGNRVGGWPLASEPRSEVWLEDGLAVFSETRYMEVRYGPGSLVPLPFGLSIGHEYYHRLLYYVAASNNLLTRLDAPRRTRGGALNATEASMSQSAGFFRMLCRHVGEVRFDSALRICRRATINDQLPDPIPDSEVAPAEQKLVAALRQSGAGDMDWFFERWLGGVRVCDYAATGTRRKGQDIEVDIKRVGSVVMPVDVELRFTDGTVESRVWDEPAQSGKLRVTSPKRLRQVVLDPEVKLLEPGRWNNYWPRRTTIRPLAALPSFDCYQLFYGPFVWFDTYHGFQLGPWAQGRQFIDAGPLHGMHMWSANLTYCTKLKTLETGAWYQTTVPAISNQSRLNIQAKHSSVASGGLLTLRQGLAPVFRQSGAAAELGLRFDDLRELQGRDTLGWEEARVSEIWLGFNRFYRSSGGHGDGQIELGRAVRCFGSESEFWKLALEFEHSQRLLRNQAVTLRFFVGAISGAAPPQSQFFLSGGLFSTPDEPVSLGYQGMLSGQENWHYDADVNCRGYAGTYVHGHYAYGVNVHVAPVPWFQPFFDFGNVGEEVDTDLRRVRMDAGVRLKLGPLYADFAFWRYQLGGLPPSGSHEFVFKWMLGLNLARLGDF